MPGKSKKVKLSNNPNHESQIGARQRSSIIRNFMNSAADCIVDTAALLSTTFGVALWKTTENQVSMCHPERNS